MPDTRGSHPSRRPAESVDLDELIAGLPVKAYEDTVLRSIEESTPLIGPGRYTKPSKESRTGLTTGAIYAMMALVATVACCIGGLVGASGTQPETEVVYLERESPTGNQPPVTVTQTQKLPESCLVAIQRAKQLMDEASNIASANGKQIDIMSKAYQAILLGDTEMLNDAAEEQRELEMALAHDSAVALVPYQQIQDGLQTCLA